MLMASHEGRNGQGNAWHASSRVRARSSNWHGTQRRTRPARANLSGWNFPCNWWYLRRSCIISTLYAAALRCGYRAQRTAATSASARPGPRQHRRTHMSKKSNSVGNPSGSGITNSSGNPAAASETRSPPAVPPPAAAHHTCTLARPVLPPSAAAVKRVVAPNRCQEHPRGSPCGPRLY